MNNIDIELKTLLLERKDKDKAFKLIVDQYSKPLYFHIRRMVITHEDANDLVQETFFNAYTKIDEFRFESSFYTWLYKISTNICLNFLNKKNRSLLFSSYSYEDLLKDKISNDIYFDGDDLQKKFQKAILTLPTKQRTVFNLRYYDEINYEDLSKILDTSVGALKSSYHHAVKKIENYINKI